MYIFSEIDEVRTMYFRMLNFDITYITTFEVALEK